MENSIIKEIQGTTVLVVDDDEDFAELMRDQLEDIGMKVVGVAHNGPEAISLCRECDPALVILDIEMKGMDGIEVARRINENEPRPIMFLSAYPQFVERARGTGVFTYLVKTVTIEKMVPSIVMTLDHFREMVALKATMEDMREAAENESLINRARGLLMDKLGIEEDGAMAAIRDRCRQENKPLADIARAILCE